MTMAMLTGVSIAAPDAVTQVIRRYSPLAHPSTPPPTGILFPPPPTGFSRAGGRNISLHTIYVFDVGGIGVATCFDQ